MLPPVVTQYRFTSGSRRYWRNGLPPIGGRRMMPGLGGRSWNAFRSVSGPTVRWLSSSYGPRRNSTLWKPRCGMTGNRPVSGWNSLVSFTRLSCVSRRSRWSFHLSFGMCAEPFFAASRLVCSSYWNVACQQWWPSHTYAGTQVFGNPGDNGHYPISICSSLLGFPCLPSIHLAHAD